MIRPATTADLWRIEHMGPRFFDASGFDQWFSYKHRCFSKFVTNLMGRDEAVVLVGDCRIGETDIFTTPVVGMAAAVAYPCWFDDSHLTAQELFWWVEPEFRGGTLGTELRTGLEDWAREKGCLTMEMGALDAQRPEALAHLYERKGYGAKDRIFAKRLT